jgi:serine/threonine-protein kinase
VCPKDGRAFVSREVVTRQGRDKLVGRVLGDDGRYALLDVLGQGGMGAVYRAVDRTTGAVVAVKAAHIDPRRSAAQRVLLSRFRREARALARLDHPRIVRLRDFGEVEAEDLRFLVMDLAPGSSLAQVLRTEGRLDVDRALSVTEQLLSALAAVHAQGLVHRDVKPQNVLVAADPLDGGRLEMTLIDFGIVKSIVGQEELEEDDERTRPGATIGTPTYMAPEQLSAGEVGPWTDVYAVGVLLYRMLAGEAPFSGTSAEVVAGHLRDPAPPLPGHLDLPDAARHAVSVALRKSPVDRFADAGEMRLALKGQWTPARTTPGFTPDLSVEPGTSDPWADEGVSVAPQSETAISTPFAGEVSDDFDEAPRTPARPDRAVAVWLGVSLALAAGLFWWATREPSADPLAASRSEVPTRTAGASVRDAGAAAAVPATGVPSPPPVPSSPLLTSAPSAAPVPSVGSVTLAPSAASAPASRVAPARPSWAPARPRPGKAAEELMPILPVESGP